MRLRNLVAVLAVAAAFAQAQAQTGAPAKVFMANPDGKGDPDAVTCRPPQKLENSRLLGPEVCKPNAEWAQYAKDGMTVSPDGRYDVPVKATTSCRAVGGGAGGATSGGALSGTMKCD